MLWSLVIGPEMSLTDQLIADLNLKPHPSENGYMSVQQFESSAKADIGDDQQLPAANVVQFLYKKKTHAPWHRMRVSDLIWIHQAGGGMIVHTITNGVHKTIELQPQRVLRIPADTWFAAHVGNNADFSLFAVITSPGFHPDNCEMATSSIVENAIYATKDLRQRMMKFLSK